MSFLIHGIIKVFKTNYLGGFVKKNIRCMTRIESKNLENWMHLHLTHDGKLILDLELGYDFIKVKSEEETESGFGVIVSHHFLLDPETWIIKSCETSPEFKRPQIKGTGFGILWDLEDILNSEMSENVYDAFGVAGLRITPFWVEIMMSDNEFVEERAIRVESFFKNSKHLFSFTVAIRNGRPFRDQWVDDFGMFMLKFWIRHHSSSFKVICPDSGHIACYSCYVKCAKDLWEVREIQDPFE